MMTQQNTTEMVMDLLAKHQPCTAIFLRQKQTSDEPIGVAAFKYQLKRLKVHGVVKVCGREGNAYIYQLTDTSPYVPCRTCFERTLKWHLHDGYCKDCRPKAGKGYNPQLDAEFKFLLSPAYQLLNQVLRP